MAKGQKLWQFFDFFAKKVKRETHVGYLGRVTAIYGATCSVQPIDLNNGSKRSMLIDVWIPKHCREDIAVGSSVAVSFFDRDMSSAGVGTTSDIENDSERLHSLNDAYVTGVF